MTNHLGPAPSYAQGGIVSVIEGGIITADSITVGAITASHLANAISPRLEPIDRRVGAGVRQALRSLIDQGALRRLMHDWSMSDMPKDLADLLLDPSYTTVAPDNDPLNDTRERKLDL